MSGRSFGKDVTFQLANKKKLIVTGLNPVRIEVTIDGLKRRETFHEERHSTK